MEWACALYNATDTHNTNKGVSSAFCCPHHVSTSINVFVKLLMKTIKNLYDKRKKHVCWIMIVIILFFLHKLLLLQPSHQKKAARGTQFVQMKSTMMTLKPMCECHQSTKQCRPTWKIIYIEVKKLINYDTYDYVQYKIILKRSCQKKKKDVYWYFTEIVQIKLPTWEILFIVLAPTSNSCNCHFFLFQMPCPKVSFTIKYTQNSETFFCENMKLTWT
jgi:hypothetical protein